MDNFEIFGLQKEPGGIDWLNGRNRIDLQIENFSDYQFYLRIKVRINLELKIDLSWNSNLLVFPRFGNAQNAD